MLKKTLLVLILPIFSGCVGLAVGTYGKKESIVDNFSLNKGTWFYSFDGTKKTFTENEVLDKLGQPDSTVAKGSCKVLQYDKGRSWSGIFLFAGIIPVPITAPTSRLQNRVYLRDGETVGLVREHDGVLSYFGFLCGSNECGTSLWKKDFETLPSNTISQWCN